jgi:predicted nucleic acid-binding protein
MIAVDANVVVKAYIEEAGSEAAVALMTGEERLVAPELIRLEVAAALCRRVRNREMSPEEARTRCGHWLEQLRRGVVALTPDVDLLGEAITLSLKIRHPLQDCMYLAIAARFDATLITADKPFHERAVTGYPKISLLTFSTLNLPVWPSSPRRQAPGACPRWPGS